MRIGEIVLKLRDDKQKISYVSDGNIIPYFGDLIAGAAELDMAVKNTLRADMAFVIPLFADADPNTSDNVVIQRVYERFGIVVALGNDESQKQKTGIVAFDKLHDIRNGLFRSMIGWETENSESLVYFRGERMISVNNAYMFYQFEFEYYSRLRPEYVTDIDPLTKQKTTDLIYALAPRPHDYDQKAYNWDIIYANIILTPSSRIPYTGDLPVDDGFPTVRLPDNTAVYIDMKDHPEQGQFARGFQSGFEKYTGD
jgi:hypothetical protein